MKKLFVSTLLMSALLYAAQGFGETRKAEPVDGKKAFEKHCAMCHLSSENANSGKPLHKIDLKAAGIKSEKDVIAKIRYLGQKMTKFDEKEVSKKDAEAIAKYIMKNFK